MFKEKYEKILEKVQNKNKTETKRIESTSQYYLRIKIDYSKLLDMLKDCQVNFNL